MIYRTGRTNSTRDARNRRRNPERGAALVTVLIVMVLLAGISASVLAVVSTDANIAANDLDRTRTFYAAAAKIEKMTSDFSALFERTSEPSSTDITTVQNDTPQALIDEGFEFVNSTITTDTAKQTALGGPNATVT
ncbi:MAG: pilus assembly PilX family protein, partial [Pyrinomonadaceae bacterium]